MTSKTAFLPYDKFHMLRSTPTINKEQADITMSKVKSSTQNMFEYFSASWKDDVENLEACIKAELKNFKKFLDYSKQKLNSDLESEINRLTPYNNN